MLGPGETVVVEAPAVELEGAFGGGAGVLSALCAPVPIDPTESPARAPLNTSCKDVADSSMTPTDLAGKGCAN